MDNNSAKIKDDRTGSVQGNESSNERKGRGRKRMHCTRATWGHNHEFYWSISPIKLKKS